jgi:hypothetical protein
MAPVRMTDPSVPAESLHRCRSGHLQRMNLLVASCGALVPLALRLSLPASLQSSTTCDGDSQVEREFASRLSGLHAAV